VTVMLGGVSATQSCMLQMRLLGTKRYVLAQATNQCFSLACIVWSDIGYYVATVPVFATFKLPLIPTTFDVKGL
jgi:hypothetical protein